MHTSCSLCIAAVAWILDRLIAEQPTPLQFVKQVDLLNRDKPSQRCKQSSCEVVNKMAPHCLLGGATWWKKAVAGKKVWADLLPVTNTTNLEAFMTSHTPEVVSVWPRMPPSQRQTPDDPPMFGYLGKSRYDVDVALYAAMAAVLVGVKQLRLRLSYNLAEWRTNSTASRMRRGGQVGMSEL